MNKNIKKNWRKWLRRVMHVGKITALVIFAIFITYFFINWIRVDFWNASPEFAASPLADIRLKLLAGAIAIVVLAVAGFRAREMYKTNLLTAQGNTDTRFSNAIGHLGHKSESIRLGGIHALHNIASNYPQYREQVLSILCGHVRTTTTESNYKLRKVTNKHWSPTIEIETILKLLFMQSTDQNIYKNLPIDLDDANLMWADLNNAYLRGAFLRRAKLAHAQLENVDLTKAKLALADLSESTIIYTYFVSANLSAAKFINAELHADFKFATLNGADLQDAFLPLSKNLDTGQVLVTKNYDTAELPGELKLELKDSHPKIYAKLKYK